MFDARGQLCVLSRGPRCDGCLVDCVACSVELWLNVRDNEAKCECGSEKNRMLMTCEDATSRRCEVVFFFCPVAERGASLLCEALHSLFSG